MNLQSQDGSHDGSKGSANGARLHASDTAAGGGGGLRRATGAHGAVARARTGAGPRARARARAGASLDGAERGGRGRGLNGELRARDGVARARAAGTLGGVGGRRSGLGSLRAARTGAGAGTRAGSSGRGRGRLAGGRRQINVLAREVVQRGGGQLVANEAEAGVGGVGRGVLHGVPPHVGLAEHGAADLLPVRLGVLERGDGLAEVLAADGEAGLGDPDGLAADGALGSLHGSVEQVLAVLNGVVVGVLEVGVGVQADPVASIDGSLVGAVDPRVPGVDVADRGIGQGGVGNDVTDHLDVLGQDVGADTGVLLVEDTSGGDAVQILAADRDTGDQGAERRAVLGDGGLQSVELVVEDVLASRGPETEQEAGLGADGSGDSRDDAASSTALLWTVKVWLATLI